MQKSYNHSKLIFNSLSFLFIYLCLFVSLGNTNADNFQSQTAKISYSESYIAQKGDTIIRYIDRQQLSKNDSNLLKKFFVNKEYAHILKDGKKITFYYQAGSQKNPVLNMLTIEISKTKILEIFKKNNQFIGRITPPFTKFIAKTIIEINNQDFKNTLIESGIADDESILSNTLNEKINLKRSLKKGAKISFVLEKYTNHDRTIIEYGDILYASLENSGRVFDVYSYNCPYDKVSKFYYPNGQSGNYSELIKPVPNAKINSKFGYRIHPVSKLRKMHNGVDLGAPKGTHIYAASSGIIKFAGWLGGYGNHIKIDHGKNIKTEYGHLSGFAAGIKTGTKVSKGQLLGYVGSSGRTTGAHLHFGVLVNKEYVDPLSFQISNKSILTKNHYKSFLAYKQMVNSLSKKLDRHMELAFSEDMVRNIN